FHFPFSIFHFPFSKDYRTAQHHVKPLPHQMIKQHKNKTKGKAMTMMVQIFGKICGIIKG
ncbi:hypothetical protein, partial [Moraxella sp. K127]|uniref:hypothetical protein n=1 Tax=Moraxella sp. K127 TaxID=2780079 RepID=UPI001D11DA16